MRPQAPIDRLLDAAARRVLDWSAKHADPGRGPWIDALRAELDQVESGPPARLRWALGSITLATSRRRSTLTRIWRSLPAPLRTSVFGLSLAVAMVVGIVWSNVIVPSHESDSEYQGWYLVFLVCLLAYLTLSGLAAVRGGASIPGAALAGVTTALLSIGIALVTFVVIDNLFLDVVMQQPDKASGFAHSGLTNQRDYVNQGNLLGFATVLPVTAAVGAACGTIGGLIGDRLWRDRPAATA
jgi:hypothetical protein